MKFSILTVLFFAFVWLSCSVSASELVLRNNTAQSVGLTVLYVGVVTDETGSYEITEPLACGAEVRYPLKGAFSFEGTAVTVDASGNTGDAYSCGVNAYSDTQRAGIYSIASSITQSPFAEGWTAQIAATESPSIPWNHAHAVYAFSAGFFTFAVFGVWRAFRRVFNDAS
jgi:hypothetical protein